MVELSIILPVYNERQSLPSLLAEWFCSLKTLGVHFEFVICEDGSTDGTKELLPRLQKQYPIVLIQKNNRRGYGRAVIEGILKAQGKWILCVDSDGQCDPSDANGFWENRKKGTVLIGWRKKRKDVLLRKIMSTFFAIVFNLLFFQNTIHDPSAPFIIFQKQTIKKFIESDLTRLNEGFWWGFVAMCHRRAIAIAELPINHRIRTYGKTQVYHVLKIPSIAFRNMIGLIAIRFSQ